MGPIETALSKSGIPAAVEVAKDFLNKIAGPAASELGEHFADKVRFWRFKNQLTILGKAQRMLDEGRITPSQIPLKTLLPAMEHSSLEENETLQEKWAALLANAANPASEIEVNPGFVETLKQLSPQDARALDVIYGQDVLEVPLSADALVRNLSVRPDDARLILANLARLGLIRGASWKPGFRFDESFYGTQFVAACSGPSTEKK